VELLPCRPPRKRHSELLLDAAILSFFLWMPPWGWVVAGQRMCCSHPPNSQRALLPCASNYFETWHLQLQTVINICDADSWKTGANTNTLQFEVFLEFFFVEGDSMHFCQQ
jgi:hypothetical protein